MADKAFSIRLLDENIAEVTLRDKVYLDVSTTDQVDQELEAMAPGRKLYQLVIATGPYVVNPEMRNAFSHNDTGMRQLAIAWVSPDEGANREQERIISGLTLPIPLRFFTERDPAYNWLRSLSAQDKNS